MALVIAKALARLARPYALVHDRRGGTARVGLGGTQGVGSAPSRPVDGAPAKMGARQAGGKVLVMAKALARLSRPYVVVHFRRGGTARDGPGGTYGDGSAPSRPGYGAPVKTGRDRRGGRRW